MKKIIALMALLGSIVLSEKQTLIKKTEDRNNTYDLYNADNLEWCTAKENIHYSYRTMSQIRNYVTCDLYKDNVFLGHFQSILDAAKYANEHYGASLSGIVRNYKSKGITLIKS